MAQREFDVLITTDQSIRHQQNVAGRHLAILVLPTTSWPRIQRHAREIDRELASIKPGEYRELVWAE